MAYWVCAPPVRAALVWDLLPTKICERLRPGSWTFPRYTRLAMGSSQSVHIIMSINITVIGRSSVASRRFGTFDHEGTAEDESDEGEGETPQGARRRHGAIGGAYCFSSIRVFPVSGALASSGTRPAAFRDESLRGAPRFWRGTSRRRRRVFSLANGSRIAPSPVLHNGGLGDGPRLGHR